MADCGECGECIYDRCEYDAYNGDWDCECTNTDVDPRFVDGMGSYYDECGEPIPCNHFEAIPYEESEPESINLKTFDSMMGAMGFKRVDK